MRQRTMEFNRPLSFDDMIRAIKCGDPGVIFAAIIETSIMLSPVAICLGMWLYA